MGVHCAVRSHGMYEVAKMWKQIPWLTPFRISMKTLRHELEVKAWVSETGKIISPMDIIEQRIQDDGHWERIQNADLNYSIIVMDERINERHSGNLSATSRPIKWDVLDGYHRLSKAYLYNLESIQAVEFTWEMLQKTRIERWTEGDEALKSNTLNSVHVGDSHPKRITSPHGISHMDQVMKHKSVLHRVHDKIRKTTLSTNQPKLSSILDETVHSIIKSHTTK